MTVERYLYEERSVDVERREDTIKSPGGHAALLLEIGNLCQGDGRHADLVVCERCLVDRELCRSREPGIGKQLPDNGVRIGHGHERHRGSSRGKLAQASRRASSISSAEGAGPRCARNP